jgi:hypothetical protein
MAVTIDVIFIWGVLPCSSEMFTNISEEQVTSILGIADADAFSTKLQ